MTERDVTGHPTEPDRWIHNCTCGVDGTGTEVAMSRLTDEERRRVTKWREVVAADHGVNEPDLAAALRIIDRLAELPVMPAVDTGFHFHGPHGRNETAVVYRQRCTKLGIGKEA